MYIIRIINDKRFLQSYTIDNISSDLLEYWKKLFMSNAICCNDNNVKYQCEKLGLRLSIFNVANNREMIYDYPDKLVGEQLQLFKDI